MTRITVVRALHLGNMVKCASIARELLVEVVEVDLHVAVMSVVAHLLKVYFGFTGCRLVV